MGGQGVDVALRNGRGKRMYGRRFDVCILAGSHGLLGDVADSVKRLKVKRFVGGRERGGEEEVRMISLGYDNVLVVK